MQNKLIEFLTKHVEKQFCYEEIQKGTRLSLSSTTRGIHQLVKFGLVEEEVKRSPVRNGIKKYFSLIKK